MRKAIVTKYLGPTNARDSRVKATAEGGLTKTLIWDDALNSEENHEAAAKALALRMGWPGDLIGGGLPNGDYCWVFDEGRLQALRGLVNLKREGGLSGNPYCAPEFRKALSVIGSAYGYYGRDMDAPTRDDEIAAWKAQG
jgi:hypothetical protein